MPASSRDTDETLVRAYSALDRVLIGAGFPATSPWWREQLERFFRSGRRRWVIRAGRRAGKSSTLCRVAVTWALWGTWSVPPGDVAVISFVSVDRAEASSRLHTIGEILRSLGAAFDQRSEQIVLRNRGIVFRVVTCSVRGTVGFTSVAVFGDEMARWESRDTAANPAKEVMGSLRPTMATVPAAFEVCSSSPWGKDDYHAELFEQGDGIHQLTSFAPTWLANPTLTEERTRELEPDDRTWRREYAAEPSESVEDDWFGAGIGLSAVSEPPEWQPWMRVTVAIDQAFASDRFGWAVVSSVKNETGRQTVVHEVGAWKPDRTPGEMAARVKREVCAKYGVGEDEATRIFCDQHEGYSFRELARREGLYVEVVPWTAGEGETSKATRFRSVRMAMLQGEFRFRDEPGLVKQFRSVRGIILPSGGERIEVPRTVEGHGDAVSALVLASSIALAYPAQVAFVPPQRVSEQQKLRAAAERTVLEKHRIAASKPGALERRLRSVR